MQRGSAALTPPDLTIGQLAARAAVPVETIRYYERCGLLPRASRTRSGYRCYDRDAVDRLGFIRSAKALGFSLSEIRELLALRVRPGASCADVRMRATNKIGAIDGRIAELLRIRSALSKLAVRCSGEGPTSDCPILDALNAEERPCGSS